MIKLYSALYDASVYLQSPAQNAGRDEVIEIGKTYYANRKDIYRSLIKFDSTSISQSIYTGEVSKSFSAFLTLKATKSEGIPLQYTIYANAVSQSWIMGTGTKFDNINNDGVSWAYRDGINYWQPGASAGTAIYGVGTTGSADAKGGTWYTASQANQTFDYANDDIRMDVSSIVKLWVSGSLPDNGFILRHSFEKEEDSFDYGILKFYSKETNTIYEPKLEIVWNDTVFQTGSLQPVSGSAEDGYKIIPTNIKSKYPKDSIIKIRLKGRDAYPLKSFGTTFEYDQSKYLPVTTYYQLEDYVSGVVIFPFGDYTKVSCDSTSNYFNLDLSTLSINRNYKIKLKIVENGISTIIDDKLIFEIV